MTAKSLLYYPYGNTLIINSEIQPYQEGFDSRGYTKIDAPNSPENVIVNQVKPMQQIASDYASGMEQVNKNYNQLSTNISDYNEKHKVLLRNAKYDFDPTLPVMPDSNTTLVDGLKNDTKMVALGQNNFFIAGTILSTTLLITGIYLGM
jgi:hypothetical protein